MRTVADFNELRARARSAEKKSGGESGAHTHDCYAAANSIDVADEDDDSDENNDDDDKKIWMMKDRARARLPQLDVVETIVMRGAKGELLSRLLRLCIRLYDAIQA